MTQLPKLAPAVRRTCDRVGFAPRRGVKAAQELEIYGKYCGPGHGDGSHCTPPDDQVDAVCCRHDSCYGREGYFDCGCDCDLVRSMPTAIDNTASPSGRDAGTAAMLFFATTPCFNYVEVCIPVVGCHTVPVPFPGGPGKCLIN